MNMNCVTITNGMKVVAYTKIPASIGNRIPVRPTHVAVIIARSLSRQNMFKINNMSWSCFR